MLDIAWNGTAFLSFACVGAGLASAVTAGARRWTPARSFARASAAGAMVVAVMAGALTFGEVASTAATDASTRATVLALGISQSFSSVFVGRSGAIIGGPVWLLASRELRSPRAPAT